MAGGWLRLRDPGRFIASDELRWTCRAINFQSALDEGRPAETFQVGHPGVLTMWLGSLALPREDAGEWRTLCRETEGGKDLSRFDDLGNEGLLQTVTPRLFTMRRGVAVGTALLSALVYLLLRAGLGLAAVPALGALALLAFEPFFLAHSRVMHVDALLSIASLAAVVALAAWARRFAPSATSQSRRSNSRVLDRWSSGAGALAGLAMLAKSSAFVLGPFALLSMAWIGRRPGARRGAFRAFTAWCIGAGLIYFALWPAMWVDPLGTLFRDCDRVGASAAAESAVESDTNSDEAESACNSGVLVKLLAEGGVPHQNGNYFWGRPVADPGPLFYPVAILFRMTPWALLGLLLALAGLLPRRTTALAADAEDADLARDQSDAETRAIRWLLAWAVLFLLFITPGPKKMDRYMLPALLALVTAAGIALLPWLAGQLQALARRRGRQLGASAGLAALLTLSLLAGLEAIGPRAQPYPLTWFNPLLGGARTTERVMLVGWGEGYDLAADFLNRQPDAEHQEAAARGVANMGPLYKGRTESMAGYQPGRTDWVVLYRSQLQRRQDEELLTLYEDPAASPPAFVGSINGLDMVWVYPNATLAPLVEYLESTLTTPLAPGDLVITGGETVLARHWTPPAGVELLRYWGHWGPEEIRTELLPALPADWQRAYVLRYPGSDPPATLEVLETVARRGETEAIDFADGSSVEITRFQRKTAP